MIVSDKIKSDGSTASYYELPAQARELQDLISFKNMNAQMGEIFRACYRYGKVEHSDEMRDIKKIIFYANAELKRLQMLQKVATIVPNKNEYFVISESQIEERSRQLKPGAAILGPYKSADEAQKEVPFPMAADSLICILSKDCVVTEIKRWVENNQEWRNFV